jgi:hypothetical protein
LFEAVHDQAAFDLVGDGLLESGFEELARDFALAETWQIGTRGDFAVGFSEVSIDFGAWHGHHDMALASSRFIDFDLEI